MPRVFLLGRDSKRFICSSDDVDAVHPSTSRPQINKVVSRNSNKLNKFSGSSIASSTSQYKCINSLHKPLNIEIFVEILPALLKLVLERRTSERTIHINRVLMRKLVERNVLTVIALATVGNVLRKKRDKALGKFEQYAFGLLVLVSFLGRKLYHWRKNFRRKILPWIFFQINQQISLARRNTVSKTFYPACASRCSPWTSQTDKDRKIRQLSLNGAFEKFRVS